MKKNKNILIIILTLSLLLQAASCTSQPQEDSGSDSGLSLTVYMVAPRMHGDASYPYTDYALGEFMGLQTAFGEESYRYDQILRSYEASHPIDLTIHYFDFSEDLNQQLWQDQRSGTLPDVIIEDALNNDDVYALLEAGLFLDLKPYADQDELYGSGDYYPSLLQGGLYHSEQLLLPLTFNLNTLMTSQENLRQYAVSLSDSTLSEWLNQLTHCAEGLQDPYVNQEVLAQFISPLTEIPVLILLSASRADILDYENQAIHLDADFYSSLARFYKAFSKQEARDFQSLLNAPDFWLANTWHDERYGRALRFDSIYEHTFAFIEGGSCHNTYPHSFAAQAAYYESRYLDVQQTFALCPIPSLQDPSRYTAMITTFGGVLQSTAHPQEAYEFLKYCLDQPYFMHYELSVNRSVTEQLLTELTQTEYQIRQTQGYFEDFEEAYEAPEPDYIQKPLTLQTKAQILDIIDHIQGATLPNWPVYDIIFRSMEPYITDGADLDTCYQQALDALNSYLAAFKE